MPEGRISPRHAAVIAYVDSLILRILSAINEKEDREAQHSIFDAPRPGP